MKCHNYEVKTSQEIINEKDKHTSPRSLSRHTGKQSKVIIIIIIIISIRIINAKHNLKQHADTAKGQSAPIQSFKHHMDQFNTIVNCSFLRRHFFAWNIPPLFCVVCFGHWLKFQI
jgi:hypothetical protein